MEREKITGKLVHLYFTCAPYPTGYDTATTREVIKALKEYGNHIQILTKGDGSRDFDLLDSGDWYGVTVSCNTPMAHRKEPFAETPASRLCMLGSVHIRVSIIGGMRTRPPSKPRRRLCSGSSRSPPSPIPWDTRK